MQFSGADQINGENCMSHDRISTLLMFVALIDLSACGRIERPAAGPFINHDVVQIAINQQEKRQGDAEFPEAIRGAWMMGPEPCYLPLNPDADGQLTITTDRMYGYEDTYELIDITADPAALNTWTVTTAEQLGDERVEMKHIFILKGSTLMAKHGNEYKATYVKCAEKNNV